MRLVGAQALQEIFLEQSAIDAIRSHVQIPRGLEEAMAANPKLKATLMPTVLEAVRRSLTNPETGLKVLSAGEIKLRVGMTLEAMRIMYCEQALSLHQCYSCLGAVLSKSLLSARRAEDIAAATQRQGIYGNPESKETVEVDVKSSGDVAASAMKPHPIADGDD